ncbi:hypothetical protein ACA910_013028 [Epithemia clementina (nom. ined.)]
MTLCSLALLLLFWRASEAFAPTHGPLLSSATTSPSHHGWGKPSGSPLAASGDGINGSSSSGGGLFGQPMGFGKSTAGAKSSDTSSSKGTNSNKEGKVVFELPATNVKVGPLRFYLQMFLFSGDISNSPVQNAWLTQQGEEDGEIQAFYHDGSGMLTIRLSSQNILVTRKGKSPSLAYQLQESVLLHQVLDELQSVASGNFQDGNDETPRSIDPSRRLLQLASDDAIQSARKSLPARKADS